MTARPNTLSFAAFIALLLIMLVPGTARSQDQKEPVVTQPTTTAAEPVDQKPGSLIVPGEGKNGPETASKPTETAPPAAEPAEAKAAPLAEENAVYIIRQGDTLWDISSALLKDPFLW
ncbi:MAG TPA: hypothetical protein VGB23_10340, partial [Nitrospirota bacterium]